MKYILFAVLALSAPFIAAEVVRYNSTFKGIQVGVSTLPDLIKRHGVPSHKTVNSNNVKYSFDRFQVTIQDKTGRVNTIIIFDPEYRDANGIRVGHSRMDVESALDAKSEHEYMIDKNNGIVYWFDYNKVNRIVLAFEMRSISRVRKYLGSD